MVLDPTTFLIVFAAAIALMGVGMWLWLHFANKKPS